MRRIAKKWSRYPTPQELILLRALAAGGAMRGVEIRESVRGKIVQGHVYVLVHRMRRKGVIERYRTIDRPDRGGQKAPIWRITAWGRRTIKAMDMLEAA